MADVTTHAVRVRTVPTPGPRADPLVETTRRISDLGTGMASIAVGAAVGALDRYWPGTRTDSSAALTSRLARAAIGVALVTERRVLGAGAAVESLTQRSMDVARGIPVVRDVLVGLDSGIDRWADRGDAERATREQSFHAFVGALIPAVVDGILARLDIAAVMQRVPLPELLDALDIGSLLEHVDLDAVMSAVDVDAIIGRVDIDGLLDRVDVNRLLDNVDVNRLMDHVDVDRLMGGIDLDTLMGRVDINVLMGSVDLDTLMGRVDIDRLMGSVDLGPLVARVLDEVDIGGIVRESTGSITTDAVDTARVGAMKLDTFVARVADRVLLRRETERAPRASGS